MDYLRVCAIDAGTRNFAFCVVDNMSWKDPLVWRHEDLWAPARGKRSKPTKVQMVDLTYAWCRRNADMLQDCDVILLETQMRTPFIIMNTVIHSLYYSKVQVVSPMTIASFFQLPKTRDAKKAAGVRTVELHAEIPLQRYKADDLADAWLMAVYGLVQRGAISKQSLDFSDSKIAK